jgi:hypothetical protein
LKTLGDCETYLQSSGSELASSYTQCALIWIHSNKEVWGEISLQQYVDSQNFAVIHMSDSKQFVLSNFLLQVSLCLLQFPCRYLSGDFFPYSFLHTSNGLFSVCCIVGGLVCYIYRSIKLTMQNGTTNVIKFHKGTCYTRHWKEVILYFGSWTFNLVVLWDLIQLRKLSSISYFRQPLDMLILSSFKSFCTSYSCYGWLDICVSSLCRFSSIFK